VGLFLIRNSFGKCPIEISRMESWRGRGETGYVHVVLPPLTGNENITQEYRFLERGVEGPIHHIIREEETGASKIEGRDGHGLGI